MEHANQFDLPLASKMQEIMAEREKRDDDESQKILQDVAQKLKEALASSRIVRFVEVDLREYKYTNKGLDAVLQSLKEAGYKTEYPYTRSIGSPRTLKVSFPVSDTNTEKC